MTPQTITLGVGPLCHTEECRLSDCVHQCSVKHVCCQHCRTCWRRTRPKTLHLATQHVSDGIHMSIAVWGIGGLWSIEADAMGCEPLVQPSNTATNCWSRQVQTCCSTPTSTQHCGWSCTVHHGHTNKMVVILCCGHIAWFSTCSSLCMTLFSPLFPYTHNCRSSMPCTSRNITLWQTCFPENNHSAPFECTHLLILRPFASTRYTCTSFHVSTLFGNSALTEQGITLTLLVTQEMSLLGLCVGHLSGNVINYWYTNLHISQVWSRSDHSVWVLHFSNKTVYL